MSLVARIVQSSLAAMAIKVGGAGLSYLMFVALAQTMTPVQFGYFSVAFSIAAILAKIAVGGQGQLALRELARLAGQSEAKDARERFVTRAYAAVFVLAVVLCGALLGAVRLLEVPGSSASNALLVAALFVPVMAVSELQTSILRAHGALVLGLGPREILWRGALCAVCFWIALGAGPVLTAAQGFLISVGLLALATLGQMLASPHIRVWRQAFSWRSLGDRAWIGVSSQFASTGVVTFAAPMLSVVVVGLFLSPVAAGAFFAALRTAQVINLLLMAMGLVASPLISRAYGAGDLAQVRLICLLCAATGAGFAALAFGGMVVFGDAVLGFFGEGYDRAYDALLLISAAYVVNAACGPNGALLEMTAHQGTFLRIVVLTNGLGILALPLLTWAFGAMGAAGAIAGTLLGWNILAVIACRRQVGVDPSILSLLTGASGARRPAP
ncbi:MAG: oligosaccharide flippase family protein [Pseudomonadota bacterium]